MPGRIDLSVVIPVYNGAATIERVVAELLTAFDHQAIEVVLVNDGSSDDSEQVLTELVQRYPDRVVQIQLARNFGEHSAVLAGLTESRGDYIGIIDDDGQQPPEQLRRLWQHLQSTGADVVYGCYRIKQHAFWRNLGSRFHGWTAEVLLSKPRGLYLSSFKVLSRFLVDQLATYAGPFPHLDGMILQTTSRLTQCEVEHAVSANPGSRYNLRRLVGLWWNLCVGFSLVPFRVALYAGVTALFASGLIPLLHFALIQPAESGHALWTTLLLAGSFGLQGVQLLCLAILGDALGRLVLQANGRKPYIVRYVRREGLSHA